MTDIAILSNSDQEFENVLKFIMKDDSLRRKLSGYLRSQLAAQTHWWVVGDPGILRTATCANQFLEKALQKFLQHQRQYPREDFPTAPPAPNLLEQARRWRNENS